MDKFQPKISVLLAVHNGEKYIYDAVKSVFDQTYKNLELIVCTNGCTDNTWEALSKALIISGNNWIHSNFEVANKSKTLNDMLYWASGDFIAIQDADDIWLPNKLEQQVKHAQNYDVIGADINYIDCDGHNMSMKFETAYLHEKIVERAAQGKNPIANCTALIRTSLLKEVGGWDPAWEGIEDYELWLRLMIKTKARFTNVNQVLALHRLHSASHFNSNPNFDGKQKGKELLIKYIG
jgi:glycosyltransferase involved in cell wall biosynthesis